MLRLLSERTVKLVVGQSSHVLPRRWTIPIEYRIDHERRLVLASGCGTLTDQDVFGYQREVWSRPDVVGYKELIDMSEVDHIALPSANRVRDLAQLSAGMDQGSAGSKSAIVAPSDIAFGLGRMYQTYRELQVRVPSRSVFSARSRRLLPSWVSKAGPQTDVEPSGARARAYRLQLTP